MDGSAAKLITEHTTLYKKAEQIFKKAQLKTNKFILEPLNEFRYCARAQVDALNYIADGGNEPSEILKLLEPGTRALKCAINDTLDFLVTFTKSSIAKIQEEHPGFSIADEYGKEEYLTLFETLVALDEGIAETRGSNGISRLETYFALFDAHAQTLIKFLDRVGFVENEIAIKHQAERNRALALQEQEAAHRLELEKKEQIDRAAAEQARASHRVMLVTLIVAVIGIIIGACVTVFAPEIKASVLSSRNG